MYVVFTVFIVVVCILLALIVLVQNSKGGGLASNFASSSQIMGVRKTNDFLEKATWTLAIALLVLSLAASISIPKDRSAVNQSVMQDQIQNAIDPTEIPEFPTTLPQKTKEPNE